MRNITMGISRAPRRKPGKNGKPLLVGDTVDVARATWTNTIGNPELVAVWKDPTFDPAQRASISGCRRTDARQTWFNVNLQVRMKS